MNTNQIATQISLNLLHAVDQITEFGRIMDSQAKRITQLESINSELIKDNAELSKKLTTLEGIEAQNRG